MNDYIHTIRVQNSVENKIAKTELSQMLYLQMNSDVCSLEDREYLGFRENSIFYAVPDDPERTIRGKFGRLECKLPCSCVTWSWRVIVRLVSVAAV